MPAQGFGDLVAAMDGAMVVVTTAAGEERGGCLVGFHCQCSIDPPRYAVWLSKANRTIAIAERATHLAVHPLGAGDHPLAEHFGGVSGDEVDKLAAFTWTPGPGGVPLLDDVPGRFVGRIVGRLEDDSDHACFVIEPEEVEGRPPVAPLRLSATTDIEPGHAAEERHPR